MQDTLLLYNPTECREGKKGLSFLPPWEFQTLLSLGTPRLLINLPRNWLSHSCPQSLPASESFPMSQLFTWGGQSTGVSALASFLPKKSPGLISFRMDWLDVFAVQGILKSFLQHHSSKALRESFPRQVDRESRGSQGERGLEFSRRKKGQTFFSFSTFRRII